MKCFIEVADDLVFSWYFELQTYLFVRNKMEEPEESRNKGIRTRLSIQFLVLFLHTVHCREIVYSDIMDYPRKCNFTKLMCNESRLLEEDKIIILNIGNEMRNRVAEGSFSYLNLKHDPVSNMNKLSWNQELEQKAASIVSSCPETSPSFISQETSILPGLDGIDYIEINKSFDSLTYKPNSEMPGCEISTITYTEELTLCAPQKIKERLIAYLTEGGLSAEARNYDLRDFWIVNHFGEPRLSYRRHESTDIGCSYLIRAGKTHYFSYLTCIHCAYNGTLPIIGSPGDECNENLQHFDEKYENLCSGLKSEYEAIKKDQNFVTCKAANDRITFEKYKETGTNEKVSDLRKSTIDLSFKNSTCTIEFSNLTRVMPITTSFSSNKTTQYPSSTTLQPIYRFKDTTSVSNITSPKKSSQLSNKTLSTSKDSSAEFITSNCLSSTTCRKTTVVSSTIQSNFTFTLNKNESLASKGTGPSIKTSSKMKSFTTTHSTTCRKTTQTTNAEKLNMTTTTPMTKTITTPTITTICASTIKPENQTASLIISTPTTPMTTTRSPFSFTVKLQSDITPPMALTSTTPKSTTKITFLLITAKESNSNETPTELTTARTPAIYQKTIQTKNEKKLNTSVTTPIPRTTIISASSVKPQNHTIPITLTTITSTRTRITPFTISVESRSGTPSPMTRTTAIPTTCRKTTQTISTENLNNTTTIPMSRTTITPFITSVKPQNQTIPVKFTTITPVSTTIPFTISVEPQNGTTLSKSTKLMKNISHHGRSTCKKTIKTSVINLPVFETTPSTYFSVRNNTTLPLISVTSIYSILNNITSTSWNTSVLPSAPIVSPATIFIPHKITTNLTTEKFSSIPSKITLPTLTIITHNTAESFKTISTAKSSSTHFNTERRTPSKITSTPITIKSQKMSEFCKLTPTILNETTQPTLETTTNQKITSTIGSLLTTELIFDNTFKSITEDIESSPNTSSVQKSKTTASIITQVTLKKVSPSPTTTHATLKTTTQSRTPTTQSTAIKNTSKTVTQPTTSFISITIKPTNSSMPNIIAQVTKNTTTQPNKYIPTTLSRFKTKIITTGILQNNSFITKHKITKNETTAAILPVTKSNSTLFPPEMTYKNISSVATPITPIAKKSITSETILNFTDTIVPNITSTVFSKKVKLASRCQKSSTIKRSQILNTTIPFTSSNILKTKSSSMMSFNKTTGTNNTTTYATKITPTQIKTYTIRLFTNKSTTITIPTKSEPANTESTTENITSQIVASSGKPHKAVTSQVAASSGKTNKATTIRSLTINPKKSPSTSQLINITSYSIPFHFTKEYIPKKYTKNITTKVKNSNVTILQRITISQADKTTNSSHLSELNKFSQRISISLSDKTKSILNISSTKIPPSFYLIPSSANITYQKKDTFNSIKFKSSTASVIHKLSTEKSTVQTTAKPETKHKLIFEITNSTKSTTVCPKCVISFKTITSTHLCNPCKTAGNEKKIIPDRTTERVTLTDTNIPVFTEPNNRQRPCICINWVVIGLIFTVAFVFAWCLLCWQRVLMF